MQELIGHAWLSGRDTIGVVIVKDDVTTKFSAFIGVVTGVNQQTDLEWVMQRGSHIPLSAAIILVQSAGIWDSQDKPELTIETNY
jgi:uncharacterized protein YfiM (DUF2279 family)